IATSLAARGIHCMRRHAGTARRHSAHGAPSTKAFPHRPSGARGDDAQRDSFLCGSFEFDLSRIGLSGQDDAAASSAPRPRAPST
ncbi:hypothetical protein KC219_25370, partial [Mycobacterium tuberculosis]|nr:hypothetical protein [Mycobacterium tuberculosis]